MSEWILCEDRLPDKVGRYLITTQNGNVEIFTYISDGFLLTSGSYGDNKFEIEEHTEQK